MNPYYPYHRPQVRQRITMQQAQEIASKGYRGEFYM